MKILYKNRHFLTSLRSVANLLLPPHGREYEDCKQILKLSLNPTHTKNARQDFSQHSLVGMDVIAYITPKDHTANTNFIKSLAGFFKRIILR